MRMLLLAVFLCAGCPNKHGADENLNPYHDVRPQKVKQQVEEIQQREDERNDKKLDEAK